ncbi:MAG TPA: hypothetical protein VJR29_00725 [bacterium]|nr:hypothetical protein [bacterium]
MKFKAFFGVYLCALLILGAAGSAQADASVSKSSELFGAGYSSFESHPVDVTFPGATLVSVQASREATDVFGTEFPTGLSLTISSTPDVDCQGEVTFPPNPGDCQVVGPPSFFVTNLDPGVFEGAIDFDPSGNAYVNITFMGFVVINGDFGNAQSLPVNVDLTWAGQGSPTVQTGNSVFDFGDVIVKVFEHVKSYDPVVNGTIAVEGIGFTHTIVDSQSGNASTSVSLFRSKNWQLERTTN